MTKIKQHLKHLTAASLGSLGETIYQNVLIERGHSVLGAHFDSHDFVVDGQRRIDVKATRAEFPRRVTASRKVVGVEYSFVTFACELEDRPIFVYDDALCCIAKVPLSAVGELLTYRSPRESQANGRKLYWQSLFPPNVKVVYRSSASTTQRRMAAQGWGPQAFYENRKDRYDWVVLILEDSGRFHHAEAYPMSARHEISFFPVNRVIKSKAAHLMTYEPNAINEKFIFRSADTLLDDISRRFCRPLK
jgi:hypothetical protein